MFNTFIHLKSMVDGGFTTVDNCLSERGTGLTVEIKRTCPSHTSWGPNNGNGH